LLRFLALLHVILCQCTTLLGDSSNDKCIEEFFRSLFSREFGYTLVGIKPISIVEIGNEYPQKVDDECFISLKDKFAKSPNFAIKIYSVGPLHCIELINRKAVRELVRRNSVLREYIKKEFRDEKDFYSKIEAPDRGIHRILKRNARIIGYLLGYDKTNIEYYIRRIEVGTYLQKYPFVRYHPIPGGKYSNNPVIFLNQNLYYSPIHPSRGFNSLEAEWNWIQQVMWDVEEESAPTPPHFVYLPLYICRHGGESEATRENFKKARSRVAELFYKKSFQEAVSEIASVRHYSSRRSESRAFGQRADGLPPRKDPVSLTPGEWRSSSPPRSRP